MSFSRKILVGLASGVLVGLINAWIELKRRDGTVDALYRHWVLGQDAVSRGPRWSVVRDVLRWVE